MKQQENNIEFIQLINLGLYRTHLDSFDLDYWVNNIYEYKKNNPISVLNSNRGGWQSNQNLDTISKFFPLCKIILDAMYLISPNPARIITSMWANISLFTNYNAPHHHASDEYPYTRYSGVIYLKVPPNSGDIVFNTALNNSLGHPISPKERDILFFPSALAHYVEPNLSQEGRISIAFNFN